MGKGRRAGRRNAATIADRLGVTVDTLFGRANEPTENMAGTLMRYIGAFPKEARGA